MQDALEQPTQSTEQETYNAYAEHLRDCLTCDTAEGTVCRKGRLLHDRWRAAAQAETAGD